MGADIRLPPNVPCAKGMVPYCLDEISKGRGAKLRLQRLSEAIASLAPSYQGLETVFDTHLMSHVVSDASARKAVVAHLKAHWFDAKSKETYFPDHKVARIYAEGVQNALALSLKGKAVVPINAWWIVDSNEVKMLTIADVDDKGVTVGGRVTLLILTPRPETQSEITRTPILGNTAHAWVSAQRGNRISTRNVREVR
jgi:hypothetical protein